MVQLGLVMLAAGASRRFGDDDKLCAPMGDQSVLEASLTNAANAPAKLRRLVVRAGHGFKSLANRYGFECLIHPGADQGMGTSIAAGMTGLDELDGVFIALGDMPFAPEGLFEAMANALAAAPEHIVRPEFEGRQGHPVLFPRRMFERLRRLTGDEGARSLFHGETIATVSVTSDGIFRDIDRPEDLVHK